MDISFELYKVFYYVAKHLSFSDASEKLFISQSAVSQSIKILEEKLGCQLMFRNTKKTHLTHEGEILFKYVEGAFNLLKSGEKNISEIHSLNQGEIRIGASDTICKYYLLPYLKQFNRLYPNIKIHVTNRTSPKCIELMKSGNVDFSIVNIPMNANYQGMKFERVKDIKDVFICGNNFRELKKGKIALKELENYPVLVLEKNTVTREYFDKFISDNNVSITPEIELGSVELLIELTKIGLGISYVMEDCIEKMVGDESVFILDVNEKSPVRGLGLLTHDNIPLSAAALKFVELLRIGK